ncbi:MAG: 4-(cytidine 5'-diphospho)-2-C-methyl-D-erythritol kinase [Acidimicrobiia bacterium]
MSGSSGLGRVRVLARTKLTLSLRVVGRRSDGFHLLDAVMASAADPHDTLEVCRVEPSADLRLKLEGATGGAVPGDASNLAWRAAAALLARADAPSTGLSLRLVKRIPVMAGLGGGSADAAAALVAVRSVLGLPMDDRQLADVGAQIGSDVPFCLSGGLARVGGRGELVESAPFPGPAPVLVVVPRLRLSTAEVYAAWDELGGPRDEREPAAPPWAEALPILAEPLVNDLEPAAFAVEPRLRRFRADLEALAQARVGLAGSGPSFAIPIASSALAVELAEQIRTALGAAAYPSVLVESGVEAARP